MSKATLRSEQRAYAKVQIDATAVHVNQLGNELRNVARRCVGSPAAFDRAIRAANELSRAADVLNAIGAEYTR